VSAARRIAFDGNPDVARHAVSGVEVIVSTDLLLPQIADGTLGHVFISNFLEHLPDAATALKLLQAVHRTLRPGGTVLILQPNFRFVGARYFDFIDHQLVLTEKSLAEALDVTGFRISHMVRRFLPYTAKSALPKHPLLVRTYLKLPILWRIFGGQTFVVGTKA
jgi:SAM-dependent methyltransferase